MAGFDLNTINLNQAECTKAVEHLGRTAYHNICTGATVEVAWGFLGWVAATFLLSMVALIVGFLLFLAGYLLNVCWLEFKWRRQQRRRDREYEQKYGRSV